MCNTQMCSTQMCRTIIGLSLLQNTEQADNGWKTTFIFCKQVRVWLAIWRSFYHRKKATRTNEYDSEFTCAAGSMQESGLAKRAHKSSNDPDRRYTTHVSALRAGGVLSRPAAATTAGSPVQSTGRIKRSPDWKSRRSARKTPRRGRYQSRVPRRRSPSRGPPVP